jgi:hypothetical protein
MPESDADEIAPRRAWVTRGIDPDALAALTSEMPASELWSLLLAVIERRAAERKVSNLLQQWEGDRFVAPSYVDQRALLELDRHLFAAAQGFEAIELSPLAPLGVCSAVALTTQNRVLSALRGTEVVSDPSNVLALESARRLRQDPALIVRLATSHRCVRAQELPKRPGFAAHFRMFCMTTAGHEVKDQAVLIGAFIEHIRIHLNALSRLEACDYQFPEQSVRLLASPARAAVAERIAAALSDVAITQAPLTHEYYDGLRFMISSRTAAGEDVPLIDGGAFNWLAKLASNRKLVFVASAIGSQLAAYLYRRGPHSG